MMSMIATYEAVISVLAIISIIENGVIRCHLSFGGQYLIMC